MCTCIGEGNGCESHVFSNTQELLGQNNLALYDYKVTPDDDYSHEIKTSAPWKKSYDKSRQCIKKQRHHFDDKGPSRQGSI